MEKMKEHVPIPSCLDSAYERKSLEDGWRFTPVFEENKLFLQTLLKKVKRTDE